MAIPIQGISQAFVQYSIGAFSGSLLDNLFSYPKDTLTHTDAVELLVQVAANGAVLALVGKYILSSDYFANDPTNGIMFILGLLQSQSGMARRAHNLSDGLKELVSKYSPKLA